MREETTTQGRAMQSFDHAALCQDAKTAGIVSSVIHAEAQPCTCEARMNDRQLRRATSSALQHDLGKTGSGTCSTSSGLGKTEHSRLTELSFMQPQSPAMPKTPDSGMPPCRPSLHGGNLESLARAAALLDSNDHRLAQSGEFQGQGQHHQHDACQAPADTDHMAMVLRSARHASSSHAKLLQSLSQQAKEADLHRTCSSSDEGNSSSQTESEDAWATESKGYRGQRGEQEVLAAREGQDSRVEEAEGLKNGDSDYQPSGNKRGRQSRQVQQSSSGSTAEYPDPEPGHRRTTSRPWGAEEKELLIQLVAERQPHGAAEWEAISELLGRCSKNGSGAERMHRSLTDPGYQKSKNKHGRRLNSRDALSMHILAAFALRRLPRCQGNLKQMANIILANESLDLDLEPRPGTKTYPRWKDALLGCFKPRRYGHFYKPGWKFDGQIVYGLYNKRIPDQILEEVQRVEREFEVEVASGRLQPAAPEPDPGPQFDPDDPLYDPAFCNAFCNAQANLKGKSKSRRAKINQRIRQRRKP